MENKILIVDDERTVIRYVSSLITGLGYNYAFIPNPKLLMGKLESENFDLILLDINMPGIDGITLLKEIKSKDEFKDIPIIMMTGDTDGNTLAKCFEYGAADYITKPINELVLKARTKAVIEKQTYLKRINKQNQLLTKKNKNINASINYARRIQDALLPQLHQIIEEIPETFIFFKPRDVVSGDFYYFHKKENKLLIAAVDCTGHGVPGAFMSLVGDHLLDKIVSEYNIIEPNLVLDALLNEVEIVLKQKETNNRDGMDIALCLIDPDEKKLTFSGANRPLICIQNNELVEIKGDRISIGGLKKKAPGKYTRHVIDINDSTMFYIFSDGYQDQFGNENGGDATIKYSSKRMKQMFLEIHNKNMEEQKSIVDKSIENWKGDEAQIDDMLVIGFRL